MTGFFKARDDTEEVMGMLLHSFSKYQKRGVPQQVYREGWEVPLPIAYISLDTYLLMNFLLSDVLVDQCIRRSKENWGHLMERMSNLSIPQCSGLDTASTAESTAPYWSSILYFLQASALLLPRTGYSLWLTSYLGQWLFCLCMLWSKAAWNSNCVLNL